MQFRADERTSKSKVITLYFLLYQGMQSDILEVLKKLVRSVVSLVEFFVKTCPHSGRSSPAGPIKAVPVVPPRDGPAVFLYP